MNSLFLNLAIVATCVAVLLSSKSVSAFSFEEMYSRILSAAGVAPKQLPLERSAFAIATNVKSKIFHEQFESRHQRVSLTKAPAKDPTYSSGMYLKYTAWADNSTYSCATGKNPYYGESVLMNTCMPFNETNSLIATAASNATAMFVIYPMGDTTCSSSSPAEYYQVPLGCDPTGTFHAAVSANHGWGDKTGYGFVAYKGKSSCASKSGTITGSQFYGTGANGCAYSEAGYSEGVACHDGGIFLLQYSKKNCNGKGTVGGVYSKTDFCGQPMSFGAAYGNGYLKCYNLQAPTADDKDKNKNKNKDNLRPKSDK